MNSEKPLWKKLLPPAIKILIFVVVTALIGKEVYRAICFLTGPEGKDVFGDFRPAWLVASGLLYLVGLAPAGLFWFYVLRRMDQKVRLGETMRAYFIGHLGKYMPGKALVVVLRTGLIRSHRVHTGLAAVSVLIETLTMMAVGAFLSAMIIALTLSGDDVAVGARLQGIWLFRQAGLSGQWFFIVAALFLMVMAGLPTLPPVFRRIVAKMGMGKKNPEVLDKLRQCGFAVLAVGWGGMLVCWVLLGLSLWAVLQSLGIQCGMISQLHLMVATVALAMVAGFLSLIPSGLGVREAVLIGLLVPYLMKLGDVGSAAEASAIALVAAMLLRLVWLAGELLISAVFIVWSKLSSRAETPIQASGR